MQIKFIAISPDSTMLASAAEDGLIILWDLKTNSEKFKVDSYNKLSNIVFSPKGNFFAWGS